FKPGPREIDVLLHSSAVEIQHSKIVHGLCIAEIRRLLEEGSCEWIVPWNFGSSYMEACESVERGRIIESCGTLVPGFCLRRVLRGPMALFKHRTQVVHGYSSVVSGAFCKPLSCSLQVLRSTLSPLEQGAQVPHGVGITKISSLLVPAPGSPV